MIDVSSSTVCQVVGNIAPCTQEELAEACSVFAADCTFAALCGGAATRAFLHALPNDWNGADVVIDSTLCWLTQGCSGGPRFFHHEPFPAANDKVRRAANNESSWESIACCMGVEPSIEFIEEPLLTGIGVDIAVSRLSGLEEREHLAQRHLLVETQVNAGRLAMYRVPPWLLYQYRPGSWRRHLRTKQSSFQFWICATRGSQRPVVNRLRQASTVSF